MAMTESKIELTERLRREDRWSEASRLKNEAVRDFKSPGVKGTDAKERDWEAMATAYPPLEPPEAASDAHGGCEGHDDELIDFGGDLVAEQPADRPQAERPDGRQSEAKAKHLDEATAIGRRVDQPRPKGLGPRRISPFFTRTPPARIVVVRS